MKKQLQTIILSLSVCTLFMFSCKSPGDSSTGDTTGVTDTEIVVGAWGPLTGPAALWGSIVKGTDAYFKMINDEGGIHGRQIRFIFKDDAYDPSRTVPVVRELVQRNEIFAVAGGIGTATNMSVLDFLVENEVPWISPMSGATIWSHPPKENIFTTFALYFDEGEIMIRYALEQMGVSKIGVIYQNDDFGKSGLIAAKHILQQNGLDFVAELPVEVTDSDLSSHVARLKESGAEVVLLWIMPRQAAIILGNSAVIDFTPTWFSSLVLSDMSLMHNITKGAWEGVLFNYVGTTMYNDTGNPLLLKYKTAFEKYYPQERWGTFPMIGFMLLEPFVEGLKIAGRDLTRESFLEAMKSIKDYTGLSGIPVNFSEDQRLGSRSLVIMKCISATEAEQMSGIIEGKADIELLEGILHGN